MNSYMVTIGHGLEFDIFHLPENFADQIRADFAIFTSGTAKEFMFSDKLSYIDKVVAEINGLRDLESEINNLMVNELEENAETLFTDDICNRDFIEKCYKTGRQSQKLDLSYFRMKNTSKAHHVLDDFDEIQKFLVKVITIVMNYEGDH